jgi:hypothetical protein
VAAQPCHVCQRSPCDAHHLKFAQPRSLGRKVSDEFTVPLCRDHHRELHPFGNEIAWWANLQIAPLEVANDLWQATQCGQHNSIPHRLLEPGARDLGQPHGIIAGQNIQQVNLSCSLDHDLPIELSVRMGRC